MECPPILPPTGGGPGPGTGGIMGPPPARAAGRRRADAGRARRRAPPIGRRPSSAGRPSAGRPSAGRPSEGHPSAGTLSGPAGRAVGRRAHADGARRCRSGDRSGAPSSCRRRAGARPSSTGGARPSSTEEGARPSVPSRSEVRRAFAEVPRPSVPRRLEVRRSPGPCAASARREEARPAGDRPASREEASPREVVPPARASARPEEVPRPWAARRGSRPRPAGLPRARRSSGAARAAPGVRREAPRDVVLPRRGGGRAAGDRLAARSREGARGRGRQRSRDDGAVEGGDASGVGRGDRGALETNEIVVCRCRGPTSRFARRCSVRARPFASRRGRTLRHHRRPRRGAGRAGGLPVRPGRGLHRGDTRRARASDDAKGESRCFTGAGFHSAAASAGRSGRTKSVRPEFCQTASRWSHFVWKKGVGRLWPRSPTASSCWTRACASSC